MLAPLPILTSITRKFKWKQFKQDAFGEIEQIVDYNALSTYPDFNEHLKFVPMLACSNLERLSSRKANLLLSTV